MVYVVQVTVTACEQIQNFSSVLILLAVKLSANLYDIYHCCVYSEKKLLMIDRRTVQNMQSFIPKIDLRN